MNTSKLVLGILLVTISGILLLLYLVKFSIGTMDDKTIQLTIYTIIGIILGILLISDSKDKEKKEFEEYKRLKQQEMAQLYRFANAKGKPIEEYLMDDRTKLITYYDRMPQKYKQQLLERADVLYRRFESEEYTNKK